MNVTSAYGQLDILSVQKLLREQTGQTQPEKSTKASGDTVSISPEAQERAKAVQEQAAQENTTANENQGGSFVHFTSSTSDILFKLMPRGCSVTIEELQEEARYMRSVMAAHERGELTNEELGEIFRQHKSPVEKFMADDNAKAYQKTLILTYCDVIRDMGLGVSDPSEKQPDVTPEQHKAVEDELIRRLQADERTNSLIPLSAGLAPGIELFIR